MEVFWLGTSHDFVICYCYNFKNDIWTNEQIKRYNNVLEHITKFEATFIIKILKENLHW